METNYSEYEDLSTFPTAFNTPLPSSLNTNLTNLSAAYNYHHQIQIPVLDFGQSSSLSSNNSSTSEYEEADENYHMISSDEVINKERKQRRMISNRESARRSRMRKQKQLDELFSQVLRLRNDNTRLINKLNNFSETHIQVVQQNQRLKNETMELKHLLTQVQQLDTTIPTTFTNIQEDHRSSW